MFALAEEKKKKKRKAGSAEFGAALPGSRLSEVH